MKIAAEEEVIMVMIVAVEEKTNIKIKFIVVYVFFASVFLLVTIVTVACTP